MSDKIIAPWKRELLDLVGGSEETEKFQVGVVAGYHEAGCNLALDIAVTVEEIAERARGFVAGYEARLVVEEQRKREREKTRHE